MPVAWHTVQTCVGSEDTEKNPCFVNSNTKPAQVLHQLLSRDSNCEASFHGDRGLLGDLLVRKGGTCDAPGHSQAELNC